MRVLKLGRRFGGTGLHAVVVFGSKIKLAARDERGRWSVCDEAPISRENKRLFLEQIY